MIVSRENLLKTLESVSPGLAVKENVTQSSMFAFTGKEVCTFNEEIACRRATPVAGLTGAVGAKEFLDLLSKSPDDNLDIQCKGGELHVKGKGRRSGLRFEPDVLLPISMVEEPEGWKPISADFADAVSIVAPCASTDEKTHFKLTCVHITSRFIEATDTFQIARYPLDLPLQNETLIRATTLVKLAGYDMTEMSETPNWLHFRNPGGLVISCRRYLDEYRDLSVFISGEGTTPVTLPGSLEEVVSRAEIFSGQNAVANKVLVDLRADQIRIKGVGASGWHEEKKEIRYTGPPIRFLITPKLLVGVSKRGAECGVGNGKLYVGGGKFEYVSCTEVEENVEVQNV